MNPFILSTYHSSKYFCDRETETSRLLDAIENNRNTALISRRRMGKTGLIKHLGYKLKTDKNIHFIYFDIMTTRNVSEFIQLFANSLFNTHKSKFDNLYDTFSKIFAAFKPSFSLNPVTGEGKFNLELTDVAEKDSSLAAVFNYISKSKKQYVIAIDEFQQIVNYPEQNFEAQLRSYTQHLNNAAFIFSGSSREILSSIFSAKKRPFYMSSDIMYLGKIENTEYNKFICEKFKEGEMKMPPDVADYILKLVGTHTYYVQLLCNRLFSEGLNTISKENADRCFEKIIEENKFYFESYHNILTDYQWKLLRAIAREKEVAEITSGAFIARHNLGSASSVSTAAKSLKLKEIIYRENSKYRLEDLLFSAWLGM